MNSHQPQERAEALFKKKQERLREGQQAMADYQAERRAVGEKTARLRALRLARDAANNELSKDTAETPGLPTKAEKRLATKKPLATKKLSATKKPPATKKSLASSAA